MPTWLVWLVGVLVVVAVIVLAGTAVLFLAGTVAVSSRESAAERDRGVQA
jgi:hypothetical protein